MAFDGSGNLWVASSGGLSLPSNIYEFGPSGGASSTSSLVSTIPFADGTCAAALSFSKDGLHLYLARQFCGNGGDVVEVSQTDGSVVRTLTTLSCATGLATDPLSGDLFVSQPCPAPNGTNNITRISNPESMTPTVSTYASPGMSGGLVFTPDGTLWTESYNGTRSITEIAGTNAATPGANAQVQSAPVNPNGQASFT